MKKINNTKIEKFINTNKITIEKLVEAVKTLSFLSSPVLVVMLFKLLGSVLEVDFEKYHEEKCGEICSSTNGTINTIVEYQEKGAIFESKETEVLGNEGPLLMNNKIFPHGCKRNVILEQTRHEFAFKNAGRILGEESIENGQLNFKLSYPGIGSHVAFITMLREMININPEIQSIQVYAPELIEGYSIIDSFLIYLEEINYLNKYTFEKFTLEETTEVYLNFYLNDTEITIHYHVDKDRERFVYADETDFDLIILHDIGALTTEVFMQELNEVAEEDIRILGPKLASQTEGIKAEEITDVEGAFHCEHLCANSNRQKISKNDAKYSGILFRIKKFIRLYILTP